MTSGQEMERVHSYNPEPARGQCNREECIQVSLFLHYNGHFPGKPVLAGLLELRMMEVVTGAIRRAKIQLKCHHQQNNIHIFTGWMHFMSANQQCQSTEGKKEIVQLHITK